GVGVPAGTPPAIVARLSREIAAGLADAGLAARFAEVGAVPLRLSSEEMRATIARDVAKWARVVKTAGSAAECARGRNAGGARAALPFRHGPAAPTWLLGQKFAVNSGPTRGR